MSADSEEEPGGRATVSLLLHPGPTHHRESVRSPEAPLVHPDSLIIKSPSSTARRWSLQGRQTAAAGRCVASAVTAS